MRTSSCFQLVAACVLVGTSLGADPITLREITSVQIEKGSPAIFKAVDNASKEQIVKVDNRVLFGTLFAAQLTEAREVTVMVNPDTGLLSSVDPFSRDQHPEYNTGKYVLYKLGRRRASPT